MSLEELGLFENFLKRIKAELRVSDREARSACARFRGLMIRREGNEELAFVEVTNNPQALDAFLKGEQAQARPSKDSLKELCEVLGLFLDPPLGHDDQPRVE
jgi:hypothetical protein